MYVLSYFTLGDESLHLATSVDGVTFVPLNDGLSVVASHVGNHSIRDPFIGQSMDGTYHLLGTDGWRSPNIVHATSTDLITWTEPTLLPVMADVPGTVNCWAPEFFYDDATDQYHIIWSSVVDPSIVDASGEWVDLDMDHSIWTCATSDFQSLSAPRVFFNPGYSVIDATVARDGGHYLMAYKDERGSNELGGAHKNIHLARFDHVTGPFHSNYGPVSISPVEGPSLFKRDGQWILIFDRFLEGSYGAVSSTDGRIWQPATINLPQGMRHGSVFMQRDSHEFRDLALQRESIEPQSRPRVAEAPPQKETTK